MKYEMALTAHVTLMNVGDPRQRIAARISPTGVVAMPQTRVFTKSIASVSVDCFWAVSAIWK